MTQVHTEEALEGGGVRLCCILIRERLTENMRNQWKAYLDIAEEYQDVHYTHLEKKRVSDFKAKWVGGVFGFGSVYGIINSERKALCISPEKREVSYLGNVSVGTFKWTGGCCYHGTIYGFPRKSNSLLMIEPQKREVNVKKLPTHYRGEHHYGGVCTKEGMVYQPPRDTNHILCIDLNSYSTKTIAICEEGVKCRYVGCVQHPSGEIYMVPEQGQKVLVLDPKTDEWKYIGGELDCTPFGVVVGCDGNIYGYCRHGKGLLKIDVEKNKVEQICVEVGETSSYGSVIGINGKIYSIPADSNQIWEFDVTSGKVKKLFKIEEAGVAKCAGAAVGCDGTICMIPAFGEYVYFLSPDQKVHIEEDKIKNPFMNTSY